MKIPRNRQVVLFSLLAAWGWSLAAQAAAIPQAAQHIPRNAIYVVFISNPAEALVNLGSVLDRFKTISPELDLIKQGEKLRKDLGENPFTREGLVALGIDPSGTSAIYLSDSRHGAMVAIALLDPTRFKAKLLARIGNQAGQKKQSPQKIAGIEISEIDGTLFGFKDSWCVLVPPGAVSEGEKHQPLLAFFQKGEKLGTAPAFTRAVARMPNDLHAWLYLDTKRLISEMEVDTAALIATMGKDRQDTSKKERESFQAHVRNARAQQKKVTNTVGFIESLSTGWLFKSDSIQQTAFLSTDPVGFKVLRKLVSAQMRPPAFHQGLSESAIASAWLSFDLPGLLNWFGPVPVGYNLTLEKVMQEEASSFKQNTKIDLFKEVLASVSGPVAFYLLTPSDLNPAANQGAGDQVLRMLKIALVAQVANPNKVASVIERLNGFVATGSKSLEKKSVAGATISLWQPEPGMEFAWGIKNNTAFVTFGKGAADALAKILPGQPWAGRSTTGNVGSGQLNFATLTETISSAVAKGIGGSSDTQFRMVVWPMAQQVLSRLDKMTFSAQLVPGGLLATGALALH